jgi:hypothetical protein
VLYRYCHDDDDVTRSSSGFTLDFDFIDLPVSMLPDGIEELNVLALSEVKDHHVEPLSVDDCPT